MELKIIDMIHGSLQCPMMDKIMTTASRAGDGGLIWIGLAALFMTGKKHRRTGLLMICALMLGTVTGELVIKNIFQRARPFVELPHLELLINEPITYSFPSGHTTSSFAAAGTVLRTVDSRAIRFFVMALACVIAFSRVYLFVHYPSDILGGIVLGFLVSYAVCRWFFIKQAGMDTESSGGDR